MGQTLSRQLGKLLQLNWASSPPKVRPRWRLPVRHNSNGYVSKFSSNIHHWSKPSFQLKETYFIVDALTKQSGFEWDFVHGSNTHSGTKSGRDTYIQVCES